MTAKELAIALTGREAGMEITSEEARAAKDAGLVVVYGYSDDNVEFAGAINEEVGAYTGTRIYLTTDGLLMEPDCAGIEDCDCPYFNAAKRAAKIIEAIWYDEGGPCWTFQTQIPHETFNIYEDGELFCVGIVFSMKDVHAKMPNDPLTLDELREMDGEPVYLDFGDGGEWALVSVQQGKVFFTHKNTICAPSNILFKCGGKVCRRRPEEG